MKCGGGRGGSWRRKPRPEEGSPGTAAAKGVRRPFCVLDPALADDIRKTHLCSVLLMYLATYAIAFLPHFLDCPDLRTCLVRPAWTLNRRVLPYRSFG